MNAIDQRFAALRQQGRRALMPYATLGFPARDSAATLVPALAAAGADFLELGIPFSDPLADGPVIQSSSQRALDNGMTPTLALDQLAALHAAHVLPPVVLMTYVNVVLSAGVEAFSARAALAGASGLIVPDLPLEQSAGLRAALQARGLHLIQMVTPNLDDERIAAIAAVSRGFVYVVSVLGVTGARAELPDLGSLAARVRRHTSLPLALGFGISSPAHAREALRHFDGVIIGSALTRRIQNPESVAVDARGFIKEFSS